MARRRISIELGFTSYACRSESPQKDSPFPHIFLVASERGHGRCCLALRKTLCAHEPTIAASYFALSTIAVCRGKSLLSWADTSRYEFCTRYRSKRWTGGALLGLALGYLVSKLTKRIDDAQIEITFTTILACGTFLLARHLHLSGVIATVAADWSLATSLRKQG